jgi:hypothetical protein
VAGERVDVAGPDDAVGAGEDHRPPVGRVVGDVGGVARRDEAIVLYNRKGIFANTGDDLAGLRRELADRFPRYELDVVGSVALFAGWVD